MNMDMQPQLKIFIITICLGVMASLMLLFMMIIMAYPLGYMQCKNISNKMGVESQYNFISGCLIHKGEEWVPYEKYRFVE